MALTDEGLEVFLHTFTGNEDTLTWPEHVRFVSFRGNGAAGWSLMHTTGGAEFVWAQNVVTPVYPVGRSYGKRTYIVKGTQSQTLSILYIKGQGQ